jgi:hypothetical protein
MNDEYLGDGVYASYDGYQIWLDTRAQHPVNRIALDPDVLVAFTRYLERLSKEVSPP